MNARRFGLAAIFLLFAAFSNGLTGQAGPYRVDLATEPAVVPVGQATLDVFVTDSSGKPVSGAQVRGIAQMPGMPMGEREQTAISGSGTGHYTMPAVFAMAGAYQARISVSGPLGSGTAMIPMQTGKSTAPRKGSTFPWTPVLVAAAILATVVFVLSRMRATGQQVSPGKLLSARVVGVLLVLAAVIACSVYVVNRFRPAGAMTPIEAQTMSMSMPAPLGSAPVTLATVESRPFNPSVRYTGQAVAFVEQDVVARTTGTILTMPLYVGDVVHRGQVLAQLDTSQLEPQLAEQRAMALNSEQGIAVARSEHDQATAMVHQAEAELGEYEGSVEEGLANLEAAKQELASSEVQVRSRRADAADAMAKVKSAEADRQYWSAEIRREAMLFQAGAVSRDEYDKERAEATKADAAVQSAEQFAGSATFNIKAAQAESLKAAADVSAASRKVDEARSMLAAHHMHVHSAEAEEAAAQEKVSQAVSSAQQAQASYQSAVAGKAYATIRAETDGVIAARLISPGVLVSPGQAILKVDQVSPIRLQANVAEEDVHRFRVGGPVLVRHRGAGEPPVEARITSISPALDPVSRTGVVEAVLPNRNRAFLPGQFIVMDISTGAGGSRLVVPQRAIQTEVLTNSIDPDATKSFVWVAEPVTGQPGRYTVHRRLISFGGAAQGMVAVTSGLSSGERVVVVGAEGLQDNSSVTGVASAVVR